MSDVPHAPLAMLALGAVLYFIPSIAAAALRRPGLWSIVLCNLLLGWTVVGWLAALVWASTRPPRRRPFDLIQRR